MENFILKRRNIILFVLFFSIFSIHYSVLGADNTANQDIVVKDFTWKSSGRGRAAILKDVTLKNLSLTDYKNIAIKIDLYSTAGTSLGSLRGTIHDNLPGGTEKIFYDIDLGIMSTSLEDSTVKIVSAEEDGAGEISFIGRSIIVKDVKFSEAQYGTEGFIKEITLENISSQNYKDVKLKVSDLGVKSAKAGYEGYVTKVKVDKVIPANSTVTLKDINIGFSHPDAKEKYVSVSEATPVSNKELRYLYANQKDSINIVDSKIINEEERKLSLVERYRQKLKENNIKINDSVEPASGENSLNKDSESSTPDAPKTKDEINEEGEMKFSIVENIKESPSIDEEINKKEITTKNNIDKKTLEPEKIKTKEVIVTSKNETPEEITPDFAEKNEELEEFVATSKAIKNGDNETVISESEISEKPSPEIKEQPPQQQFAEETKEPEIIAENNNENPSDNSKQAERKEALDNPSSQIKNSSGKSGAAISTENTNNVASAGEFSSGSANISGDTKDFEGNNNFSQNNQDISFPQNDTAEQTASIRDYNVSFEEGEIPIPGQDIVVKKFTWGTGIPGTLGRLSKLILENISGIAYTDIDILVEYFSPAGIPLGSSQFKLKEEVIEPKETKEFRNLDVGLVQLYPIETNIKISVKSAKDI